MTFNDFLNKAWNDHVTQSEEVAARWSEGSKLITEENQIGSLAHLITDVFGEHLGQWDKGVHALLQLKQNHFFKAGSENDRAISRSIAILEFASGKRSSLEDFSASDQIRILAMTASALSRQKNSEKAPVFFNKALELAQNNLTKDDPANRVLAIIGNNLASSLEVQASLTPIEKELMILAAKTARKYWEIAGTWLEVERAEYRLAHTFLKAGDLIQALEHAQTCLEITEANKAPALEFFFGYEALALVEKARGNNVGLSKAVEHAESFFDQLKEDDKTWCESTLKNIKIT